MEIDVRIRTTELAAVGEEARRYERMGFDAVWSFDTGHDPFLPLLEVALATERLQLGTNIAVAFARSPFSMAQIAWDLQRASRGRLHLGLGTQVRAHVERRFSMPFEHPAARITDFIRCVREVWNSFQTGERPRYEGRFYRYTLINDFFNPGPIDHPEIPIYLAGVNERMCVAAGEVADGFAVHPMHSPGYLRDVVRPALDEGARLRGKTVDDLVVHSPVFAVVGETEAERSRAEQGIRQQVAFYASTPSYRRFLEYHGYEGLGKPLSDLMRRGEVADMIKLVPDELVSEVAITADSADRAALGRALQARYPDGLLQRASLYSSVPASDAEDDWRQFTASFRG